MDKWVSVQITPGLFPSERAIRLPTTEGEVSLFVSLSQLNEVEGLLRVLLLDEDEHHALVQLPSQGGSRVAKVLREAVRSTPG